MEKEKSSTLCRDFRHPHRTLNPYTQKWERHLPLSKKDMIEGEEESEKKDCKEGGGGSFDTTKEFPVSSLVEESRRLMMVSWSHCVLGRNTVSGHTNGGPVGDKSTFRTFILR